MKARAITVENRYQYNREYYIKLYEICYLDWNKKEDEYRKTIKKAEKDL